MCDDDIHQGLVEDPTVSRRTFGLMGVAAVGLATTANAATARGVEKDVQVKTPDLGGVNNTIEAVLYCKSKGIGAYQGGTCNETDRSAQVCVHCAMATQPAQLLAKPGMGVDEGFMIVYNEMSRIIALRNAKKA